MKKYSLLILFLFGITSNIFAQTWQTKSKIDDFNGKLKIASAQGTGNEFPYQEPIFVINYWKKLDRLNIYIVKAGYAGCDNKTIYLKFPEDENIYWCSGRTDKKQDAWYLDEYLWKNERGGDRVSAFELLKKYSSVTVRLDSDCDTKDFKFSLSGSTKAIEFVTE